MELMTRSKIVVQRFGADEPEQKLECDGVDEAKALKRWGNPTEQEPLPIPREPWEEAMDSWEEAMAAKAQEKQAEAPVAASGGAQSSAGALARHNEQVGTTPGQNPLSPWPMLPNTNYEFTAVPLGNPYNIHVGDTFTVISGGHWKAVCKTTRGVEFEIRYELGIKTFFFKPRPPTVRADQITWSQIVPADGVHAQAPAPDKLRPGERQWTYNQ